MLPIFHYIRKQFRKLKRFTKSDDYDTKKNFEVENNDILRKDFKTAVDPEEKKNELFYELLPKEPELNENQIFDLEESKEIQKEIQKEFSISNKIEVYPPPSLPENNQNGIKIENLRHIVSNEPDDQNADDPRFENVLKVYSDDQNADLGFENVLTVSRIQNFTIETPKSLFFRHTLLGYIDGAMALNCTSR